jgi:hypothetical protein
MTGHNHDEKRQELRLSAQETLYIEVDSGDDPSQIHIVISNSIDVSANGVQLSIDRPLIAGSIHRVCLQRGEQESRLYLSAEVMWSRALPDEGWAVGLQILESDGTDVLGWKEWIAARCALDSE